MGWEAIIIRLNVTLVGILYASILRSTPCTWSQTANCVPAFLMSLRPSWLYKDWEGCCDRVRSLMRDRDLITSFSRLVLTFSSIVRCQHFRRKLDFTTSIALSAMGKSLRLILRVPRNTGLVDVLAYMHWGRGEKYIGPIECHRPY